MAKRLQVDSDAIHGFARQIRSASRSVADARLPEGHGQAFESTVAEELRAASADLGRRLTALHELTSSLARAADRAADELMASDAGLAGSLGR
jgi:hypothetical protein